MPSYFFELLCIFYWEKAREKQDYYWASSVSRLKLLQTPFEKHEKEENHGGAMKAAFSGVMTLLLNDGGRKSMQAKVSGIHRLQAYWTTNYPVDMIDSEMLSQRPLILDPANPANNVAKMGAAIWYQLSNAACRYLTESKLL